jgi:hypothetical protein
MGAMSFRRRCPDAGCPGAGTQMIGELEIVVAHCSLATVCANNKFVKFVQFVAKIFPLYSSSNSKGDPP